MRATNPYRVILCLVTTSIVLAGNPVQAAGRKPANVPPGDEIEVLDPNADPLRRPAVELRRENGQLEVDIPPVVLVHKYYYTGDRSFQAQLLPGGPTILVVNHPKTGERCYIETNMMPGAPYVTYKGDAIVYDFGEHGMTVDFPIIGQPKVCYRSGISIRKRIGNAVHAEQIRDHAANLKQHAKAAATRSHNEVAEFAIDTHQMLDDVLLPVKQIVRYVPMANTLFDPDRATVQAEKIAEHKRTKEAKRVQKQAAFEDLSMPTNR